MQISTLTNDEFINYLLSEKKHGNTFYVDGVTETDAILFENGSEPEMVWQYGTFSTVLHRIGKEWRVGTAGGTIPLFRIRPKAVNEEQFYARLKEISVPDEIIENYKKTYNEPFPENF